MICDYPIISAINHTIQILIIDGICVLEDWQALSIDLLQGHPRL